MNNIKPVVDSHVISSFILQVANNLMRRFSSPKPRGEYYYRSNKIVYHYASIEVLYKIIESESLISTNVLYLNDTAEYKSSRIAFKYSLESFLTNQRTSKLTKKIVDAILLKIDDLQISNNYITCFSADGDLLSQWMAYGDRGRGVAIGFKVDHLQRCFQYIPVGAWVEYDSWRHSKNIETIQLEFFKSYSQLVRTTSFKSEDQIIGLGTELYLRHLMPTFLGHYKNSSFKQENEYRLALRNDLTTPLEIDFMPKNSTLIVPYTKLILKRRYLDDNEDDFLETLAERPTSLHERLPIEEIILGPCIERAFAEPGIKMFLEKFGYKDIKVKGSGIPLRYT